MPSIWMHTFFIARKITAPQSAREQSNCTELVFLFPSCPETTEGGRVQVQQFSQLYWSVIPSGSQTDGSQPTRRTGKGNGPGIGSNTIGTILLLPRREGFSKLTWGLWWRRRLICFFIDSYNMCTNRFGEKSDCLPNINWWTYKVLLFEPTHPKQLLHICIMRETAATKMLEGASGLKNLQLERDQGGTESNVLKEVTTLGTIDPPPESKPSSVICFLLPKSLANLNMSCNSLTYSPFIIENTWVNTWNYICIYSIYK